MSLEEFLAWEERQELRWEFDGFVPMAMTGGTAAALGNTAEHLHRDWRTPARPTVPALHL